MTSAQWLIPICAILCTTVIADEPPRKQQVLLLAQSPDGHPPAAHEYIASLRIMDLMLRQQPRIETRMIIADSPWSDGPALLDRADAAVLFLAEGAKWVSADAERHAAFQRLAERKGGLTCLHWAMGTKPAENVPAFTALFGGCHGGPDRKYQFLETELRPTAAATHPVTTGIVPLTVRDEFYYALKWAQEPGSAAQVSGTSTIAPLMEAHIDDEWQTVAWAWDRPDGGRSFGFSGLHYHGNWSRPEYRRLVLQGVLWTLGREIPSEPLLSIDIPEALLPPP
jgi:type 1 glutamine amidotransferase